MRRNSEDGLVRRLLRALMEANRTAGDVPGPLPDADPPVRPVPTLITDEPADDAAPRPARDTPRRRPTG